MYSPHSWGPRWWRLWATLAFMLLLLLLARQTVHGQSAKPNEPLTLAETLPESLSLSTQLVLRLQERRAEVETLRASLEQAVLRLGVSEDSLMALQEQLEISEQSLATLQVDLTATSTSLAESRLSADNLSLSFEAYRTEMTVQVAVLGRERTFWQWLTIGSAVAFLVALVAVIVT